MKREKMYKKFRLTGLGKKAAVGSFAVLVVCISAFAVKTAGSFFSEEQEAEAAFHYMEVQEVWEEDNRQIVCIDAGHGGSDCGAEYNGDYEKNDTLVIAELVKRHLESAGVKVVMTRDADIYLGLDERVEICNNASCDAVVSIHRNFYQGDSSVNGVETWIHSSQPEDAYFLANSIMKELEGISGVKNRGIKSGSMTDADEDYRINRNSNCTSCLLELGFMTNSGDRELVTTKKEESAKAIADGIMEFLEYQKNLEE